MPIDNEEQALTAIETWRSEPLRAQQRYLQEAKDSLEMSAMYYEQKDNALGLARMERCLSLIRVRQGEVESA